MSYSFRKRGLYKNSISPTSKEFESYLFREILEPWFPACLDKEYGGFLCDFDRRWRPNGPHKKLLEFQARHTWVAAEASLLYPDAKYLKEAALHGFRFLMDVMWDTDAGGWFHQIDCSGKPLEMATKHMHGVAYAISTCIAVYAATENREALKAAFAGFEWLDKHAHDDEHGGYFGFLNRDGKPIKEISQNPLKMKSDTIGTPMGRKDANVHIDLLETFIYLYCITPNEKIKERLAEIISIVTTKFGTEEGRIYKFCKFDWSHDIDIEGFGYTIQAAHRLLMASQICQEENTLVISAKRFIDHALNYGWDNKYGGMFASMPGKKKY